MADILRLIHGLLHGTQENSIEHSLLGLAAGGFEKFLNLWRRYFLFLDGQAIAEA